MRIINSALEGGFGADATPADTTANPISAAAFTNQDSLLPSGLCYLTRKDYQYFVENLDAGYTVAGNISGRFGETLNFSEFIDPSWKPSLTGVTDRIGRWTPPAGYVNQTRRDRAGNGDTYPLSMLGGFGDWTERGWDSEKPSGGWKWESAGVEYDPIDFPGVDYIIKAYWLSSFLSATLSGTAQHKYLDDWLDTNEGNHRWGVTLPIAVVVSADSSNDTSPAWEWEGLFGGFPEDYDDVLDIGGLSLQLIFPDGSTYRVPWVYASDEFNCDGSGAGPSEIEALSGSVTITLS